MFCSIGSAIAFADSVTGSETDRSKIGATNPAWNNPAWAEPIKTAMLDEYERLEGIGFNPGSIADYIGHWEVGFKQDFNNSDGTYAPLGETRNLIMFYNALKDKAYSLYNKPYEVWNSGTNKDSLLMPTSNQYKR